jgi:hypothetical protein
LNLKGSDDGAEHSASPGFWTFPSPGVLETVKSRFTVFIGGPGKEGRVRENDESGNGRLRFHCTKKQRFENRVFSSSDKGREKIALLGLSTSD